VEAYVDVAIMCAILVGLSVIALMLLVPELLTK